MGTLPVEYMFEDNVARVTLSRPQRRDAIDAAMQAELTLTRVDVEMNSAVRVVVLAGVGVQASCSDDDNEERRRRTFRSVRFVQHLAEETLAAMRDAQADHARGAAADRPRPTDGPD